MSTDDVLTMIPGPTPVRVEILDALARPTTSHQAPGFVRAFTESLARLRRVTRTETAAPFVVSGSGTLAMEMALVNLLAPGERLLVISQGYFGDRWSQLAESFGMAHDVLRAEWGQVVDPNEVRAKLDAGGFAALAMTHVDTSTGAAAPVEDYARSGRERGVLTVLDGVCATAGMDERFDDWNLDVLLTGAQKALGAPPGVAILLASDRAMAKRNALGSIPAYYADLLRWQPVMEQPSRYFSTPPVNEVVALNVALGIVLDEGLDARFDRHRRIAAAVREGLAALGLEVFTAEACRADTLSVVLYPGGLDDAAFRDAVARRGVVIAGGLGPLAGRACRVGHMGNIGRAEVARALDALGGALVELGRDVDPARAVEAAERRLDPA